MPLSPDHDHDVPLAAPETGGGGAARLRAARRIAKNLALPALAITLIVSCSRGGDNEEATEPTLAPELSIVTPTPVPPGATVVITPTPTPDPSTLRHHTVEAGESLSSIADEYGVSQESLQELNGIEDPNSVQEGQDLLIPPE